MGNERQICSKESPMPDKAPGMWSHPDAKSIFNVDDEGRYGGNYTRYKCPNCNLVFEVDDPDY